MAVALSFAGLAIAQQPSAPLTQPAEGHALVRFVNLAPNATPISVALTHEDGGAVALTALDALPYGGNSDYHELRAGTYDMTISVGDASSQLPPGFTAPYLVAAPDRLSVSEGGYYTVALMGLLLPENFEDTSADDDGFFGWLRGLFGGDTPADRDALALRVEVFDDDLNTDFAADEARVRLIHAAPGAAPVDLVSASDRGVIIGGVAFGDVSGYHVLAGNELGLSLRAAGSEAEVSDLAAHALSVGNSHTVFLIGTPFEGVPLQTLVYSNMPAVAP